MTEDLWVRQVENPTLRPLNQWRDELFGFWMIVTDATIIDGISMAIARYYGTDREKLLDIWNELCMESEEPTAEFFCNKRSNWMGGAFIAKINS